jgi:putative ABC transport system permease protein
MGMRLGLADLLREPWVLVCQVAALCAVVAPLLVLAGLRVGVVEGLLAELRDDPANLRIIIRGDQSLRQPDLERVRALPGVGFLLPVTRSIAARAFLLREEGGTSDRASLLPSTRGDPLLPPAAPPLEEAQVALSETLVRRMGVAVGERVIARNARGENGREAIEMPMTVVAVVRDDWLPGASALVHPLVLERIEAFLDGFAVPDFGIPGEPPEGRQEVYAGMRLYARSLEDVGPLAEQLRSQFRLETVSAEERIGQILGLDRNLLRIFALVTLIAGSGLVLSIAAQVWANVERKRAHLSVLRLMGGSRGMLALFPLAQALAVACCGFAAALGVYWALASLINHAFTASMPAGTALCRLSSGDVLIAGLATALAVGFAAAAGGLRASRIEPFEGIIAL